MKIKKITYQNRRDFKAIFECEHCESTEEKSGYDDSNFHNNVIPNMKCENCGSISGKISSSAALPDYVQI